jgi:hypothetical protein
MMGEDPGRLAGQRELKSRAPSRVGGRPPAAAIGLDDRSTDREPHAGALRLGREECTEDLVYFFALGAPHRRP